jgi:glyoxylate reductase
MAAARRLGEGERLLRASEWAGWSPTLLLGVDVHGKTLGIFGMGRIGQALARRAKGFDMRVLYCDPTDPEVPADLDAAPVDLDTLLAESDFISIHCPLLPGTRHVFGAAQFRAMKKTACLINTSRGPIVDEAALAAALQAGEIFAAGLDVYEDEPRVHPDLLECSNAVLVPHLGSATHETRSRMAEIAARNIVARLRGQTPPNCVNPESL